MKRHLPRVRHSLRQRLQRDRHRVHALRVRRPRRRRRAPALALHRRLRASRSRLSRLPRRHRFIVRRRSSSRRSFASPRRHRASHRVASSSILRRSRRASSSARASLVSRRARHRARRRRRRDVRARVRGRRGFGTPQGCWWIRARVSRRRRRRGRQRRREPRGKRRRRGLGVRDGVREDGGRGVEPGRELDVRRRPRTHVRRVERRVRVAVRRGWVHMHGKSWVQDGSRSDMRLGGVNGGLHGVGRVRDEVARKRASAVRAGVRSYGEAIANEHVERAGRSSSTFNHGARVQGHVASEEESFATARTSSQRTGRRKGADDLQNLYAVQDRSSQRAGW
mmetsp:Transcript_5369/g.20953  ORF Transcript_5369/g.20953 Transcript_5369/m.20953 type:complete len:338 (-) Transcript_5369:1491-2504(-)